MSGNGNGNGTCNGNGNGNGTCNGNGNSTSTSTGIGSELWSGVEGSRLAADMRELRGRTGLSLAALAARTPYSKSSWERYLNGKKLPPKDAVEALCRLADEPAGRLVALWELADTAWSGRAALHVRPGAGPTAAAPTPAGPSPASSNDIGSTDTDTDTDTDRDTDADADADAGTDIGQGVDGGRGHSPGRLPRRGVPVAAGACVGVLAVVAAVVFWAGEREGGSGVAAGAVPSSSAVTGCRGMACDGKDPQSMFCGGEGLVETPVERTVSRGRHIEVRYAKACGAAWGRLRNGRVGDRIEVSAPGSEPRSVKVRDHFDAEGYLVTPMAAARGPQGIRLCLYPAGGAARECFAR